MKNLTWILYICTYEPVALIIKTLIALIISDTYSQYASGTSVMYMIMICNPVIGCHSEEDLFPCASPFMVNSSCCHWEILFAAVASVLLITKLNLDKVIMGGLSLLHFDQD